MVTKVWLHPLVGRRRRKEQSSLARDLLRVVCEAEGIALSQPDLRLPGLELIDLFARVANLGLSIAHCSGMLAIALGPGKVGIDCEARGKNRNWLNIADHFFTPTEANAIATDEVEDRESVFLRHWVLKEAYIKAIRGSVFGDLNRLVIEGQNGPSIDPYDSQSTWMGWEMEFSGSPIAVCSSGSVAVEISTVNPLSSVLAECVVQCSPDTFEARASVISMRCPNSG